MKRTALMLTAWLASACAAKQATTETVPMATVVFAETSAEEPGEGAEPAKEEEQVAKTPEPLPPLPTLTQEEYNDAFMRVATCYDFHIPPAAQKGFSDKIKLVIYEPCFLENLEQSMLQGVSLVQPTASTLTVAPIRPFIFEIKPGLTLELSPEGRDPQLCVTPDVVGGTFPAALRCSNLAHEIGTDKYSLVGLTGFYMLGREAEKAAQQSP